MDNVYIIYYITEYSNSEIFNSGRHIWIQSTRRVKNRYGKDKKLVYLTFIFTFLTIDLGGGGYLT